MRRLLSFFLAIVLIFTLLPSTVFAASHGSMDNFALSGNYKQDTFQDVSSNAWYAEGVANAYELGLMKGNNAPCPAPPITT